MIHLGDITKISGYDAPVVDCIIGGSPCQDLSVAGKRAGLAGERSGLFMEQIRIIKEMREADKRAGKPAHLIRPRFMLWENVPGAFSSHKGQDFRAVLEETIRIAEPNAPDIPLPAKGKWPLADCWMGDGWSVAYRVLDAQFWGVPQRRRRIALVADFGGRAAPEILFVRQSMCGDFETGAAPGQKDSDGVGGGAYPAIARSLTARSDGSPCTDRGPNIVVQTVGRKTVHQNASGEIRLSDTAYTLGTNSNASGRNAPLVYENHGQDSRLTGPMDVAPTVAQKFGTGGNNTPLVAEEKTIVMATGQARAEILEEKAPTLNCNHEPPIVMDGCLTPWDSQTNRIYGKDGAFAALYASAVTSGMCRQSVFVDSFVRRLTPLECERLQGYPDGWTDIGPWTDSKGKVHKESSDSARYRALGNSIALPPWKWVIKRLCSCYERDATMASLFDGIGGFPLIWEQINGRGSCLWASEIEKFPIAVTKRHFNGGRMV